MKNTTAKLELIVASVIFGSIGVLRKAIPLASGTLSITRGFIGAATLLLILLFKGQKINWKTIRSNILLLALSGISVGINWIMIFDAFNYTSVAVSSLCYYTAPVFIIVGSAIAYKEKITKKNIFCIILALFGMSLVSGFWNSKLTSNQTIGVILSVGAAILYSTGIVINKKLANVEIMDRTIVQLFFSSLVVVPYSIFFEKQIPFTFSWYNVLLILILGIFHTGIAFALTYDSVAKLDTKTVAFFTYIDPIVSVIMSALVLHESITIWVIVGAVCIIGSAVYNELKTN